MRVGFWAGPASLWFEGGAKVQIHKTQEGLEKRGIEVVHLHPWRNFDPNDVDIIHCFGGGTETLTVLEVVKAYQIPAVISVFGTTSIRSSIVNILRRVKYRLNPPPLPRITKFVTFVICLSQEHAHLLSSWYGIPIEKFRVVPNGIDVERFSKASPELFTNIYGLKDFVLQVATVRRLKGQIRLIEALKGEGLQLVFIGPLMSTERDYTDQFLSLVEKNKDQVKYLGPIEHEDPLLASAFAAARVHVLPSEREGLPLVNLEAAAAGCTVVSGRYPGLSEYLGDQWFPCNPRSISSIKKAVLKAYKAGGSPYLRKRIQAFSWDNVVDKLIEVYQEAMEIQRSK